MDFALTQEQRQIRDTVAEFVDAEVAARAAEIDETDEFPRDLIDEMADLGLMGMPIPEEYGGAGLDCRDFAVLDRHVGRAFAARVDHCPATNYEHTPDHVATG